MSPINADALLAQYGPVVLEVEKLVRLAVDRTASLEERRTAAFAACERLKSTGALERVNELRQWIERNRKIFDKALATARAIQALRGG